MTAYDLVYILLAILGWPWVAWKMLCKRHYRTSLRQKRGFVPRRTSGRRCLCVHGVSGGEIPAAEPLVRGFARRHPNWDIVISTTTEVGMQKVEEIFPDLIHIYWPLDFSWMVRRSLDRIRPDVVVTIETELWPNVIEMTGRRGIPYCIMNGRFSESTVGLHKKFWRWGLGRAYRGLSAIGVQSDIYARRLHHLGVDPSKVSVTGSLKYESVQTRAFDDRDDDLLNTFNLQGKTVIVAGSTHNEEEGWLLEAYARLRQSHPECRLVLAPRKPHRWDEVAQLVTSKGFSLLRRTTTTGDRNDPVPEDPDVVLLDTFGELMRVYSLADVVFVGRSLVPFGGSNIMEPAALEKPVVFGPHMENFPEFADEMVHRGAALRLSGPDDLHATFDHILTHPDEARAMGRRGRDMVEQNRGAAERSLNLIEPLVDNCS